MSWEFLETIQKGHLLRGFLATEDWFLVTGMGQCGGGRTLHQVGSSIRKLLVSRFVYRISRTKPFVEKLEIDSERVIEIVRAVKNKGKTELVYSDHFPAIITITNLPRTQNVT